MPCLITSGFPKDCNYKLGGLSRLFIGNLSEVDTYTDADPLDGVVEAVVMLTAATFFEIEFERNTGSFTADLAIANGQTSVTQTVTFNLGSKGAALVSKLKGLALGDLVVIAEDKNGARCILGRQNGLRASAGSLSSGAAEGDFAGVTWTLTAGAAEFPPTLIDTFDITTILP